MLEEWLSGAQVPVKQEFASNGLLAYLNGTIVDPTNGREVNAFCVYYENEGETPESRAVLRRWADEDEIVSGRSLNAGTKNGGSEQIEQNASERAGQGQEP